MHHGDDPSAPGHPVRMLAKHLSAARIRLRLKDIRQLRCPGGGHLVCGHDDRAALYLLERGRGELDELGPWPGRQVLLLARGQQVVLRNPGRRALTVAACPLQVAIGTASDPLAMLELPALGGPLDADLRALWTDLMRAGEETRDGNQWARPRARGLATVLLTLTIERGLAARWLRFHPERRYPLWLHHVLEAVEQRLADPDLTVDDLAAVAELSASRFSARFREHLDVAPKAYVLSRRLALARDQLRRAPQRPIAAIAAACGFRDPFHFSRQFRRTTGRSPTAWRTEHR